MDCKAIDQKAIEITQRYKRCEVELLDIIQKVYKHKVYLHLGYPSLFKYVVERLRLSESQAYCFINVAKKSVQVPSLKKEIERNNLTVNQAKRITSVITEKNQDKWLEVAQNTTQKQLEREVVLANPKNESNGRLQYVAQSKGYLEKVSAKRDTPRVKLEVGISEELMLKIRRAQDLISQKNKHSVNLEATLERIVNEFIRKNDPLEKAKRQKSKGQLCTATEKQCFKGREGRENRGRQVDRVSQKTTKPKRTDKQVLRKVKPKRQSIPARIRHQLYLNSAGRCSYKTETGEKCQSGRFLEIHHIKPLAQGGGNELENLELLCSGHHKVRHNSSHEP